MRYVSSLPVCLWLLATLTVLAQPAPRGIKIAGGTAPPGTEQRLALVIGNKDYQYTRSLTNPVNDAQDLTKALQTLGFEVITLTNVDYRALQTGLNTFRDRLTPETVALVYYSGHGVSYGGKAYLLPTDAQIRCLDQIDAYGISLNRVLGDISSHAVRNSFVFLDACRNLPDLKVCDKSNTRDLTADGGLVKPSNNPRGSMVVYATREGSTADDNTIGRNGLFTEALLRYLTTPNLGIRTILDKTAEWVETRSDGRQSPGRYDELRGDFVFVQTGKAPTQNQVQGEIARGVAAFGAEDYPTAFQLLSQYSDQLDPAAQTLLGQLYHNGWGTVKDLDAAMRLYRKAADQGNGDGQANLGSMYANGQGDLVQDMSEAKYWFLKAAKQGNALGQVALGDMCENGEGGFSKDLTTAVSYYQLAARQGNEFAQAALKRLGKTW